MTPCWSEALDPAQRCGYIAGIVLQTIATAPPDTGGRIASFDYWACFHGAANAAVRDFIDEDGPAIDSFDLRGSGPDAFVQPLIVLPLVVSHNFERKNRIAHKGAGRYHDHHEGGYAGHTPHRVESGARA